MSQVHSRSDHRYLLPADWWNAPKRFLQQDRYTAFTFFWTMLFLGTLGLWAPIIGALLTGNKPVTLLWREMIATGALYLFVIPFVASISYSVFTTAHVAGASRPWRLDVLKVVIVLIFVICLFLMPHQVLAEPSLLTVNGSIQVIVSVLSVVAGIYIFCLLKLDVEIPYSDQFKNSADDLKQKANDATSNSSDFT